MGSLEKWHEEHGGSQVGVWLQGNIWKHGSGMNMVRKKGQPRLVTLMKQIGEAAELKGMQESSTLCPVAGARISGTWTGQL